MNRFLGKSAVWLFVAAALVGGRAHALLPTHGYAGQPFDLAKKLMEFGWNDTYRIGDEWGKKPVTDQVMAAATTAFSRTAQATAIFGGGTAFYLGYFDGLHMMATNHHVLPTLSACKGRKAKFPMLRGREFSCVKAFGTWTDIDLALFAIDVKTDDDAQALKAVGRNFAWNGQLTVGQELLTIGFGVADNPGRKMVANQDSDCKVFSPDTRFIADPDKINPGPYKAWSFANGCDVSHGDSGSAMVDRNSGDVIGIIWTGALPKEKKTQTSAYLTDILKTQSEEIWQSLSYGVPALRMAPFLQKLADDEAQEATLRSMLKSLLHD